MYNGLKVYISKKSFKRVALKYRELQLPCFDTILYNYKFSFSIGYSSRVAEML